MDIDEDKIDDAVLALLWLTLHSERCAWKVSAYAHIQTLHRIQSAVFTGRVTLQAAIFLMK